VSTIQKINLNDSILRLGSNVPMRYCGLADHGVAWPLSKE